jgi:hypothetical protein
MKVISLNPLLMVGASILISIRLVYGQEPVAVPPQPGSNPVSGPDAHPAAVTEIPARSFRVLFLDAFRNGTINLNARLRYEFVSQEPIVPGHAHALTLRTRLGFTTAPLHGFQGMLEFENITAIPDDDRYRLPGATANVNRPVVADPETTELNQAWLSYSNWRSTVKGGRQRVVLDNHRFIGDVGWRQNQQTFDAITLASSPVTDLSLFYGYVWEVNRVFGDVAEVGPPFADFESSSHLLNLAYTGCPYARLVGYAYLLDLENAAGHANSSATYGISLSGAYAFDADREARLNYRAEYAFQSDYADQPADYSAHYFLAEVGGDYDRFTMGGGYEWLGSGSNRAEPGSRVGFKTPLATLHAFNGWADVFLTTPDDGLQDVYAFAGVRLPGNVPLRVIYHQFFSDRGNENLGYEIDVVASRAFGPHFNALLKYAYFDGRRAAPPAIATPFDKHVFWAQAEFNF